MTSIVGNDDGGIVPADCTPRRTCGDLLKAATSLPQPLQAVARK